MKKNTTGNARSTRDEVFSFIRTFISENGYGPTVREIGTAVGLSSTAAVYYHLCALRDSGQILMDGSKRRAIAIPGLHAGTVPLIGTVTAGLPVLAVENIEGYIPYESDDACFALRVRGDSMIGAAILDGDVVVVRQQQNAENGDIVVALLGEEATVKRLSVNDDEIFLMPENPAYAPIDAKDAVILGRVKTIIRTL